MKGYCKKCKTFSKHKLYHGGYRCLNCNYKIRHEDIQKECDKIKNNRK